MKRLILISATLILFALAGCQREEAAEPEVEVAADTPETATVTVTITYRERIALSPEAVLEVSVEDISRADAPAKPLSRVKIKGPGQVPIPFKMEFDSASIDERMTYAVRASISDQGRLMFTSDTVVPVLTRDAGNDVELVLVRVNSEPSAGMDSEGQAELTNTYWRLDELDGAKVTTPEGMKEAHMILSTGEPGPGVKGFGGCNPFFGQFETDGDALSFSAMGSTMMACPEGMDTERDFLAALGETTRYQISGLFLELYAGDQLLARLEAVYL